MTLSELTQAVHDLKMAKYPHAAKIPHYFPTIPFVANSANSLTRCIEAYIRVTGGYADRINNTGIYDPKTGKWRKSGTRKGIADIMATKKVQYDDRIFAVPVAIEVKWGKDRLSEDQLKIKAEYEAAGGVYLVARTWEQFIQDYNNIK